MLSWFDAREAKLFGSHLAKFFISKIPLDLTISEKKLGSKTEFVLKKMAEQVASFKRREKLNVYKRAQLGNAFKWELKDSGYDDAYIEALTGWLVTKL
jgi:hypothetical protein